MIRIKLDNLNAGLVARGLLEQRGRTESATARVALREAAVQVLEQLTDMRIGTLYVHLDTPNKPWMLLDLKYNETGTKIAGVFSRKDQDDYASTELADWRTF